MGGQWLAVFVLVESKAAIIVGVELLQGRCMANLSAHVIHKAEKNFHQI